MAGAAKRTTDHEFIRRWVEEHGGHPAHVKRTEGEGDPGILRIDFPGYSGGQSLEKLSWDDFFAKFEESELAFLYQEDDGGESRFSKLVRRSGEEEEPDFEARSGDDGEAQEDGADNGQTAAQDEPRTGRRVADIMSSNPETIEVDASLHEAAKKLARVDAGALPVVEEEGDDVPIGMITDRDIVTRALAQHEDVAELSVRDVMTSPAVTIGQDDDIEDAVRIFEQAQLRRAVVVDEEGRCRGMLAQADLAFAVDDALAAELLRAVSQETPEAARLPE